MIKILLNTLLLTTLFSLSGCSSKIITPEMFNAKKDSVVVNDSIDRDRELIVINREYGYKRFMTPTLYLGKNGKIYYEIVDSHNKNYNRLYTIYPTFDFIHYMYDEEDYIKESKNINRNLVINLSLGYCLQSVLTSKENQNLVVDCGSVANMKNKQFLYLIRKRHFYESESGTFEYIDLSKEALSVLDKFKSGDMSFLDDEAEARIAKIFLNRGMILYMLSKMSTEGEIYELHRKVGVLGFLSKSINKKFTAKLKSIH